MGNGSCVICLRREGRAKLGLLTIIIPIAIGVIVEPCWGLCASLPIFLCLETVSCWGDLEICLLLFKRWQEAGLQDSFLFTWGGVLVIRGCLCSHHIVIGGFVVIVERFSGLLLGLLVLWLMKSGWLLLWRSLGPVRLLSLRPVPLFSLAFQVLLSTRLIGSLDARDNEEFLNITFKDFIIEDVGTKDHHPVGVQHRMHASGKGPGDSLLTVHNESDRLTLHSYSHMVPLAISEAQASEDGLSGGLWPSPLVLIEKADWTTELQAQLLDSLGTV